MLAPQDNVILWLGYNLNITKVQLAEFGKNQSLYFKVNECSIVGTDYVITKRVIVSKIFPHVMDHGAACP